MQPWQVGGHKMDKQKVKQKLLAPKTNTTLLMVGSFPLLSTLGTFPFKKGKPPWQTSLFFFWSSKPLFYLFLLNPTMAPRNCCPLSLPLYHTRSQTCTIFFSFAKKTKPPTENGQPPHLPLHGLFKESNEAVLTWLSTTRQLGVAGGAA